MKHSIPGFSTPQVGLDQPLEMLSACHDRVQNRCDILHRLYAHLEKHGPNEEAQSAAKNILFYFDTSAKHHHEDEEADLFPALLKTLQEVGTVSEKQQIPEVITLLLADHRKLETLWLKIRPALALIAAGKEANLENSIITELSNIYEKHIHTEENVVFPLAKKYLGAGDVQIISERMTHRRSKKV